MSSISLKNILLGSLATFAVSFVLYLFIVKYANITFCGTANGAYKALAFYEWKNLGGSVETGNVLYFPIIKVYCKILKAQTPLEIYYCIVFINGFFSSVLLALIFAYFLSTFKNYSIALIAVATHFFLRGYFVLATNNEDIFPSYVFYVIGALSFRNFITHNQKIYLAFTVLCFSLAALLHWTSGIPAFGALFIYLLFIKKNNCKDKAIDLLGSVSIVLIAFALSAKALSLPFNEIIFPSKGNSTLWVSAINIETLLLSILNVPIFILFGAALEHLKDVVTAWPLVVISIAVLLWLGFTIKKFWTIKLLKTQLIIKKIEIQFLIFLTIVFVLGTLMNAYEQGCDLQFFVQPVFIVFYLLVFVLYNLYKQREIKQLLIAVLLVLIINSLALYVTINYDQRRFNELIVLKQNNISVDNTLFIGSPFELFHIIAKLKSDKPENYKSLQLPEAKIDEYNLYDSAYLERKQKVIEKAEEQGLAIVVINFMDVQPEKAGKIYNGYDLSEKMRLVQLYLKTNFRFKEIPNTGSNKFYILKRMHG